MSHDILHKDDSYKFSMTGYFLANTLVVGDIANDMMFWGDFNRAMEMTDRE